MLGLGLGIWKNIFISQDNLDPDYLLWENELTVKPTGSNRTNLNQLIIDLKAFNLFSKIDVMYVLANFSSEAALTSMINPTTFTATEVNSPTFTVNGGYKLPSTAYLDTNFNDNLGTNWPAINGVGSYGIVLDNWGDSNTAYSCGAVNGSQQGTKFRNRQLSGGRMRATLKSTTFGSGSPTTNGNGFCKIDRGVSARLYHNGVNLGAHSSGGFIALNFNHYIGSLNVNGSASNFPGGAINYYFWYAGGGIDATDAANFSTAVKTYLDAIGVSVIP
jgi:hypothetical protein